MRKHEVLKALKKPAMTVMATVAVCVAILLSVQPWQTEIREQAGSDYLSAKASPENDSAPAPGPAPTERSETIVTASIQQAGKSRVPPPVRDPARNAAAIPLPASQPQPAAAIPAPQRAPVKAEEPELPDIFAHGWDREESDEALAPLLSYDIGRADIDTLKEFVEAAFREEFTKARGLMSRLDDPVAAKFARWYYYRKKAPDTEASEIIAFLDENPLWPGRDSLQESAEDALFWREQSADRIVSHFERNPPASGVGLAAYGKALIELGREAEGAPLIRKAWRLHVLTPAIEKRIRKLKALGPDDHRARAGFLLIQDSKSYIAAAKRVLPLIEKSWQDAVKAHIATVQRAKNAGTLLTRLDETVKADPAILFARAQWLRRAGNNDKARSLLISAPQDAGALIDSEEWWKERQIHIRSALNEGDLKTAYALAKGPNAGLEHWDLSDAEFLAGWIAFRFQNDPAKARGHFEAAAAAGGLPKRRSRAAYWLGRVETALGNDAAARARFAEASQHHHTFYGQLAHQMIVADGAPLALEILRPAKHDIEQFVAEDVMQAMVVAQKAEFENLLSLFMYDLARQINSAPQMILACELAARLAPAHRTVRMAKIAINRDFPVEAYAYPRALPPFRAIVEGQDVEEALIHALTRQESEFNTSIVSSAGAVGLMQLLPSTAKFVASRHKVPYAKSKLSADPAYNVSLGSAFLHQLISNYDGSYIMALAGYNAGPGRVRDWARAFGDPRKSDVDPIDWIERIPFSETRDYVHKVLESAQLYRARLLQDQAPIMLAEDLHRGRNDKPLFLTGSAAN